MICAEVFVTTISTGTLPSAAVEGRTFTESTRMTASGDEPAARPGSSSVSRSGKRPARLTRVVGIISSNHLRSTTGTQVTNSVQFLLFQCSLSCPAPETVLRPAMNTWPAHPKLAGRHDIPFAKSTREHFRTWETDSRSYFLHRQSPLAGEQLAGEFHPHLREHPPRARPGLNPKQTRELGTR